MRLTIASRQSDLARLQAYKVGHALKSAQPELEIKYHFRESLGDKNQNDPLWRMPEKGVFTEDFVLGLKNGEFDCVVHSWKDLPTFLREGSEIVATLPRADQRDLILFRSDRLTAGKSKLKIYSSSPRREYNLKNFLQEYLPLPVQSVEFLPVRGNIQTRVRKLLNEDVDALVVAKAALDRLLSAGEPEFRETQEFLREALKKCQFIVTPLSINPAAAAQGALAIEIASHRDDLRRIFEKINCASTFKAVRKEREILAGYGGGCHQKIGVSVLNKNFGEVLFLKGLTDQGEVLNQKKILRHLKPQKVETQKLWPQPDNRQKFFSRESLMTPEIEKQIRHAHAISVSRENAWPEGLKSNGQIVWSAGLKTWKSLAQKGIWVSGSSESLGEENPGLDELMGEKLKWLKLTHAENVDENSLATYRLVLQTQKPDLRGKTHFFWSSGSGFRAALALFPEIRDKQHACGPGSTFHTIQNILQSPPQVFLDFDDWWNNYNEDES
jgi:hydroxymethylbilane synthase